MNKALKDLTVGILEKELEYAKSIGNDTLQRCIDRLKQVDDTMEHLQDDYSDTHSDADPGL